MKNSKIKFIRFRSFYDCGCMVDIVYEHRVISCASEDMPKTAIRFLASGNLNVTPAYDKFWGYEIVYTVRA